MNWDDIKLNAQYKKQLPKYNFIIEGIEMKKLSEWITKHDKICEFSNPGNQGAIGGRFTYEFTPTSLGVVIKVKCACGETEDITNYDLW